MSENIINLYGKNLYYSSFQRTDVPYSIVVQWCYDQLGEPFELTTISGQVLIKNNSTWTYLGSKFYFENVQDHLLFEMTWI